MAAKNIKQKNIKVNQSGTNTSGQSLQQLQAAISGLSKIPPNSPYGSILNQTANLMSGALQQQLQQQQSSGASSGSLGNVNWSLADLPFDSKLLVSQMPKYEEITQTKENEERPLNWEDIVNSQKQILDYNNQLKQLNAQNWANYLQQTSGVEAKNNILRGLDEQNSNTFQKNFADIQKTGAYGYGYDPYGGLRDLRPAPEPPKFEKPIELKEIGKQTKMTEKTIKSGTDYSTQILSPQQQGTTTSSTSSSGPGSRQKMELLIQDAGGNSYALNKDGNLELITRKSAMDAPGAVPDTMARITNTLFQYGGFSNFDADSKASIDAFSKFIANANIGGLNRQQWIDKIKKLGFTPKYAARDLAGAQLIGWWNTGNTVQKAAVVEALKGFFGGNIAKTNQVINEAMSKQQKGNESGYDFLSYILSRAAYTGDPNKDKQLSEKDLATKKLEAVNTLALRVGKTIFSGLGSLLKGYKDREYIPDYLKTQADDDIATHLVRMAMY